LRESNYVGRGHVFRGSAGPKSCKRSFRLRRGRRGRRLRRESYPEC
jgi:hypothetical protein